MRPGPAAAYTWGMTTTTALQPSFTGAGLLLDSLTAQDFEALRSCLDPGVRMRALVVRGLQTLDGPDQVTGKFSFWYGETDEFEVTEASIGEVAGRLHLSWRIRLRAQRFGEGFRVIEQHSFADCGADGRLTAIDLVCTGYLPERGDQ